MKQGLGLTLLALAFCGAWAGVAGCGTTQRTDRFSFSRPLRTGENRTYPAVIERPRKALDTGVSVLLIGGGYGWDLHWTMAGSYEADGERVLLTLDGTPTRDADRIAARLVNEGFTVLRWSSVFDGDPKYDPLKGTLTPVGVAESFELTRAAIEAFRERGGFHAGELVLLGHSLGAARAGVVAEASDVAGAVMLAGAYVSPTREFPSRLSTAALERHGDTDGDGVVSASEFGAPAMFEAADADGDGLLRGWELAAWDRSRGMIEIDDTSADWVDGERWPSTGLKALNRPVLALFGGLDPISVHGPWLEAEAAADRLRACEVMYFPTLGHNLSVEVEDRIGPIDHAVLDAIVDWLERAVDP